MRASTHGARSDAPAGHTVPLGQSTATHPPAAHPLAGSLLRSLAPNTLTLARSFPRSFPLPPLPHLSPGLGEKDDEVLQTMRDIKAAGVDILTFGQYLQPTEHHLPVIEFVSPEKFDHWKKVGEEEVGFRYVASGPLVRSSYKAGEFFIESMLGEQKKEKSGAAAAAAVAGASGGGGARC